MKTSNGFTQEFINNISWFSLISHYEHHIPTYILGSFQNNQERIMWAQI